jgi:polysaccharide biosynthesis protein VpsM
VNAGLSYRAIAYQPSATSAGRTDDYMEGSLGASYVVNASTRLVGAYAYRHNGSKLAGGDFTNNVFSLSASLRY